MSQKDTKTIGKDYTLGGLLKFALPAVLNEFMFNLLYTLDDGLFITRYVGTTAESAFLRYAFSESIFLALPR